MLHATAVAVGGKAVLITGASGAGKSSLALEMMARGATLVADDQVRLTPVGDSVVLTCPQPLQGLIEARGIGLLHAEHASDAVLALVVDMDQTETDRMPPHRKITYFTKSFPRLHNVASQHFPAALIQYLRCTECNAAQP
ncbi:HPr kinase/phosphatase C-terminal domain-containing protein [Marivita sp. S6314]|uniref:HPr kinase/phosphorylase n=1 Tax=Marivita sp. S6314 TaxID=2926406 RepID=UPI001FF3D7D2|nr:HPr kinase/phosphatase C-terminal domain-containing protein [Marivita sp. S6314]MCK0150599.1 HPr kinase/phosphatase C-terminal domain-containing protein [Marivita sp. S6314]